ncbi:UNVERIFIED_CONTAM: hypothetical protein Cloal_0034 [Acetivibrio alkalicellulosi]
MKKLNKLLSVVLVLSLAMSSAIYVFGNNNRTNDGKTKENNIDKELNITLRDEKNIKLKYDYSFDLNNSKDKIHKYRDDKNNEIFVNEDKKITGIIYKENESKRKSRTNFEQLKKIAQKEVENYVDINDYCYETYRHHEQLQTYTFIWTKYINSIKTVDSIQVTLSSNGELLSTIMPNVGLFNSNSRDKMELSRKHISEEEAVKFLEKVIKNNFKKLNDISLKSYSILEEELCFVESGDLVWKYFIELQYYDEENEIDLSTAKYVLINAISGETLEIQY